MEDELVNTEQRIALYTRDQDMLSVRSDELESSIAEMDGQLDLCFESDKDDLAKNLIRKRLESERLLKRLVAKHGANEKYLAEQQAMLDENQTTLESLRQKAELFAQRPPAFQDRTSEIDDIAWMAREMSVSDDEVEIAYLREKGIRSSS